jgi:hypothetical protein
LKITQGRQKAGKRWAAKQLAQAQRIG